MPSSWSFAITERSRNLPSPHRRYPLVMINIANWKITIFNGKIHYFYGNFQ